MVSNVRMSRMAKRVGRSAGAALLGVLLAVTFFTCAGDVLAQAPPDGATAKWAGGHSVNVIFDACQSSGKANCACPTEGGTDCYPNNDFSIYRNPPGFTQLLVAGPEDANVYQHTYLDVTVTPGQTYTYMVCGGGYANSSKSNCVYTKPVAVPNLPPPPPSPQAGVQLSANPTVIQRGQTTTLSWTSENVTGLTLAEQPDTGTAYGLPLSSSLADSPTQTTTYTMYASGPYGSAKASVTVTVNAPPCQTLWAPPGNVTAVSGLSDIPLKWTNPNINAGQTCPAPASQILIYRMETGGYAQLAALDKASNNGALPTHYTDSGPLQPHTGYDYEVCEGGAPDWQKPYNCASPPGVWHDNVGFGTITWGADPVLTATRVSGTTVQLRLALDQYTVTSVTITRQGSDDPCRQGGTLSNGLQGCPTTNGLGGSPAQTTTVYSWTQNSGSLEPPGLQNSQSAPYVIDVPDDTTVKPGVEYYYQAQVVWQWSVGQDSGTVTVPSVYAIAPSQALAGGGPKPIKLSGAPPVPPQSQTAARPMIAPMASPVSRRIASAAPATAATPAPPSATVARPTGTLMVKSTSPIVAPSSPTMSAAGSTAAPPAAAQSTVATRPMMAPMMGSAPTMLQPGQPMMSSTGAAAAPPQVRATTGTRPAITPMRAQRSRTVLPVRRVVPLPGAANLAAAIKEAQQKPHDAQALYALGKAYCASTLKNTGVSYMYMALLLAENAGNAPLAAQIKTGLAAQGVSTK